MKNNIPLKFWLYYLLVPQVIAFTSLLVMGFLFNATAILELVTDYGFFAFLKYILETDLILFIFLCVPASVLIIWIHNYLRNEPRIFYPTKSVSPFLYLTYTIWILFILEDGTLDTESEILISIMVSLVFFSAPLFFVNFYYAPENFYSVQSSLSTKRENTIKEENKSKLFEKEE